VYARELTPSVNFLKNRKEAKMADKDTGTGFTIGFIVGAAMGLAIGFLYAPRPGEETRHMLREKTEQVKGKTEEMKEKATEVVEKVKETTAEAGKKAKAKFEETKEQAK
jgi:gas vesicle protein